MRDYKVDRGNEMLIKIGDTYEPVFKLDDLERFMDREVFDAVVHFSEQAENDAQQTIHTFREMYKTEERIADERFQIINSTIQTVDRIRTDLKEGRRLNRNALLDTLNELMDNLTNY